MLGIGGMSWFLVSLRDQGTSKAVAVGCLGNGLEDGRALTTAEEGRFGLDLRSASLVSV